MSKKSSPLGKMRRSKNARLILLAVLLVILGIMYFAFEKFRIWILGLMVVVLGALGMEMTNHDYDVQKLMETGSFSESRVNVTENGTWLIGECQKKDNFNCSNFAYQEEAQRLFDECGGVENDIHRLDGDKDGIVCESLRQKKETDEARSIREILGLEAPVEAEAEAEAEVETEA